MTRTGIESDTSVAPLDRSAPRNTYDAAGALAGTETPTSQVSVAPGATENGVLPITIAQPRGTESDRLHARRVGAEVLHREHRGEDAAAVDVRAVVHRRANAKPVAGRLRQGRRRVHRDGDQGGQGDESRRVDMLERSVSDGELRGEHRLLAGVGEDHGLVRAARQRAQVEVLMQRRAGVEQAARLPRLGAERPLCVVDLDPERGAKGAFAAVASCRRRGRRAPAAVLTALGAENCTVRVPEFWMCVASCTA